VAVEGRGPMVSDPFFPVLSPLNSIPNFLHPTESFSDNLFEPFLKPTLFW
jgi:hypothetical protein